MPTGIFVIFGILIFSLLVTYAITRPERREIPERYEEIYKNILDNKDKIIYNGSIFSIIWASVFKYARPNNLYDQGLIWH